MIPILYDQYETAFTSNGHGRLTECASCIVTEERNGIFECEFTYPITGKHYERLTNGATIGVIHDDNHDIQPFDVYSYSAPIDGVVTFYAHHISYRLNNIIVQPFEASSAAQAMALIVPNSVNPNPFTFWTDKGVSTNFGLAHPNSVKALLGGQEGSILDVYGKGDYKYDKFEVRLYVDRGSDTGVTIRYGKNLVDIQKDIDKSGSYSAIAPYWKSPDNEVVFLPEIYVVSPTVPTSMEPWTSANNDMTDGNGEVIYFNAAQIVPTPVDFTGEFMQEPTVAQLRQAAIDYLDTHNTWLPNENITIDFTQMWQTPEYENVAVLQRVGLCDTISVYYPELGVVAKDQKVIKVVYNVLNECFDSMELGQLKTTLAQTLQAGIGEQVVDEVTKQLSSFDAVMQAAIDYATKQITGGTGGYVVMTMNADNQPQELLIMDTPSTQTAVNVWRWNSGGLGHSHSGYNGPYSDVALTQDGKINAAMITTGIMTATLIRAGVLQDLQGNNYWNLETGEFRLAATTQVGDSTIATQSDIAGVVTATDVEYGNSDSENTAPSTWTTNAAWVQGKFLWTRTKMTLEDGTTAYSPARRIAGGSGLGVSSVVEQYYLSTSNSSRTGGSWSDSQQAWVSGRYYWTRSKITWSDGSTTYTTATLAEALTSGNQSTDNLDTALNQQAIFNRLTNNGQTQGIYLSNGLLYINASYIQSGTLSANYIKGGTLEVGGIDNQDGVVSVLNSSGVEMAKLSNTGFRSKQISSSVEFETAIQGARISVTADGDNMISVWPGPYGANNVPSLMAMIGSPLVLYKSEGGVQTTLMFDAFGYMPDSWMNDLNIYQNVTIGRSNSEPYRLLYVSGNISALGNISAAGNLTVMGSKSRRAKADEFGERLLYCYETSSPMFGDVGEGVIDETGLCFVFLDPVFGETITTSQYQVFLQRYGEGDCYVSERHPDYFVVKGEPGLSFGWELKSKQKDFDQLRLEREQQESEKGIDYGEQGCGFYFSLEEGRIA